MKMRQFIMLFRALFSSFIRDRQSIVFTLAFPIIFLLIFGFVFSGSGDGPSRPVMAVSMPAEAEGLRAVLEDHRELLIIKELAVMDDVVYAVRGDDAQFGMIYDSDWLHFYYNPARLQNNPYYRQLAGSITTGLNTVRTGAVDYVRIERREVAVREAITQLEYMLPGIIALGLFSSGVFAITASFMHLREKGVLKRLAATPMIRFWFMGALMVTRLVIAFLSSLIILGIGRFVFNLSFVINWPWFVIFIALSTLAMMGLGFLITIFARSARNASEIASVLLTIMIFFSGVYFPIEFLPVYFRRLALLLPLYHIAEGLRSIMNVAVMNPGRLFVASIVMVVWTVLTVMLSARRVRWEERV